MLVLYSFQYSEKHTNPIKRNKYDNKYNLKEMSRKVKEIVLENITSSLFSDVLLPVYNIGRTIEKHRISNTETDIDEILNDILKMRKRFSTASYEEIFIQTYGILISKL